mmetsp:Transcript_1476/g.3031  ORF Transcript_1476/g.3031 Transcript_1476/m.3031 type:complete len:257 (-) Transcript_1476:137-907(-)
MSIKVGRWPHHDGKVRSVRIRAHVCHRQESLMYVFEFETSSIVFEFPTIDRRDVNAGLVNELVYDPVKFCPSKMERLAFALLSLRNHASFSGNELSKVFCASGTNVSEQHHLNASYPFPLDFNVEPHEREPLVIFQFAQSLLFGIKLCTSFSLCGGPLFWSNTGARHPRNVFSTLPNTWLDSIQPRGVFQPALLIFSAPATSICRSPSAPYPYIARFLLVARVLALLCRVGFERGTVPHHLSIVFSMLLELTGTIS